MFLISVKLNVNPLRLTFLPPVTLISKNLSFPIVDKTSVSTSKINLQPFVIEGWGIRNHNPHWGWRGDLGGA